MDKTVAGNKASSEEVTRESLISISYCVPDVVVENLNSEKLVEEGIDCDGADKYRSELISISNQHSPVIKSLPVPVAPQEELEG